MLTTEQKKERKIARKRAFTKAIEEHYPIKVDLITPGTLASGRREAVRNWIKIRNYVAFDVSGYKADIIWDKNWRYFYFNDQSKAVDFVLNFS
jgi:hypothetical protein